MEYKRLSECSNFISERTSNITIDNYISTENMIENRGGVKIASTLPDVKSTSAYKPNDILISNIRPYFCKIWFADRKGSCSNDVLVVRAKKEINPKFLYYVLSDQNFFNWDSITSKGTKMPRGTPNAIMKYSVPDIPFPTQQKIASILSAYDDLIQNCKKQIQALQTAASELYKEWFVRFRFPGYQNTKFENGIPEGWKIESVGKYCNVFTGKKDVNQTVDDGLYNFFSCSPETFKSNDYLYDGKAILVAGNGSYTGRTRFFEGKFDLYQRTYAITTDEKNLIEYLFWVFKNDFEKRYSGGTRGAAIPYIVLADITKYKFLYSRKFVEKFISVVIPINKKIDNLKQQITNLTQQRDLLLPRLMSGKLEV